MLYSALSPQRSVAEPRKHNPLGTADTTGSQLIQSHQKKRSMLSSSKSQNSSRTENPYRAGQSLAAPP